MTVLQFPARRMAARWRDAEKCTATLPCAECRKWQRRQRIARWFAVFVACITVGVAVGAWWALS